MTASGSSTERAPGASPFPDGPESSGASHPGSPADDASTRRAVDALQRLRGQLRETQEVLDDFLTRLDDTARRHHDAD